MEPVLASGLEHVRSDDEFVVVSAEASDAVSGHELPLSVYFLLELPVESERGPVHLFILIFRLQTEFETPVGQTEATTTQFPPGQAETQSRQIWDIVDRHKDAEFFFGALHIDAVFVLGGLDAGAHVLQTRGLDFHLRVVSVAEG